MPNCVACELKTVSLNRKENKPNAVCVCVCVSYILKCLTQFLFLEYVPHISIGGRCAQRTPPFKNSSNTHKHLMIYFYLFLFFPQTFNAMYHIFAADLSLPSAPDMMDTYNFVTRQGNMCSYIFLFALRETQTQNKFRCHVINISIAGKNIRR